MTPHASTYLFAALLLLVGCDTGDRTPSKRPDAPQRPEVGAANTAIERDVASIKENAQIAAVNKRLDELEAEVSALKTNSQTIDIDLLKQRLAAVETAAYSRDANQSAVVANATAARNTASLATPAPITPKPNATRKAVPETKTARSTGAVRSAKPAGSERRTGDKPANKAREQ